MIAVSSQFALAHYCEHFERLMDDYNSLRANTCRVQEHYSFWRGPVKIGTPRALTDVHMQLCRGRMPLV